LNPISIAMYLEFYNLKTEPFRITPNPEFLYLSPSHQEALATLAYGIEQGKGFVALIGEVGLGKTTLIREFLKQRSGAQEKIIYLFNSRYSFIELLRALTHELELNIEGDEPQVFLDSIYQVLIGEYAAGRQVILLMDEAQIMPEETLEGLRLISNLETPEEKLIQIALIGQPELENKLSRYELRQLNQRIAVKATLAPLSREESLEYIKFRISKAGGQVESIFSPGALKGIIRLAKGVPRVINILCDNTLVTGYGYARKPVPASVVREVARDLRGGKPHPHRGWAWSSLAAVLAALVILGVYFQFTPKNSKVSVSRLQPGLANMGVVSPVATAKPDQPAPIVDKPIKEQIPVTLPKTTPVSEQFRGKPLETAQPSISTKKEEKPSPPAEDRPSGEVPKTFPQTRVVQEGQNLSQLVIEVYGKNRTYLWDLVRQANPQIKEDMKIRPGQKVVFPSPDQVSADKAETPPLKGRANNPVPIGNKAMASEPTKRETAVKEEKPSPPVEDHSSGEAPKTFPQTRIVREGENLSKIVLEVYGVNRKDLWALVRRANPQINEDMKVKPGQKLIFPEWKKETAREN
jgi:general secretion pathway protein A